MLKHILSMCLLSGVVFAGSGESITGHYKGYRGICQMASCDDDYFGNFRTMDEYRIVLELEHGQAFADYVTGNEQMMANIETYRLLDTIGNPPLEEFTEIGKFTPTTLRYMVLGDQMNKIFRLPSDAKIAEIGVGFGGQCYVLSKMNTFDHYYMYDLPEVENLVNRVMDTLQVSNVTCLPIDADLPVNSLDLVISNYAFSECDRLMQMHYFNQVIKKAKRGYIIYNQISEDVYSIKSLSLDEFVGLLRKEGFQPKVFHEFLSTAPGNMLITWDCTKNKKR